MNRFHLHIAVRDLAANIDFYSKLFNEPPSKQAQDYAKWMLDDPPVNFAISQRGHTPGINHVGIEAGTPESLVPLRRQADLASQGDTIPQGDAACCYAKSEKHWTIDPQGLAWEHFYTHTDLGEFGEDHGQGSRACCIPIHPGPAQVSTLDGQASLESHAKNTGPCHDGT